jgi:hypothetical protein
MRFLHKIMKCGLGATHPHHGSSPPPPHYLHISPWNSQCNAQRNATASIAQEPHFSRRVAVRKSQTRFGLFGAPPPQLRNLICDTGETVVEVADLSSPQNRCPAAECAIRTFWLETICRNRRAGVYHFHLDPDTLVLTSEHWSIAYQGLSTLHHPLLSTREQTFLTAKHQFRIMRLFIRAFLLLGFCTAPSKCFGRAFAGLLTRFC